MHAATPEREARTVKRSIRDARFPAVKSFESFAPTPDQVGGQPFDAIPALNKNLVFNLARCESVARR